MVNKESNIKDYDLTQYEKFLGTCLHYIMQGLICKKVKTYINIVSTGYTCATVFKFGEKETKTKHGKKAVIHPKLIRPKDKQVLKIYNDQIKYAVEILNVYSNSLYCGFCENCGKLVFSCAPHQSPKFCRFCIYQKLSICKSLVYLIRSPATKLLKIGVTTNIEKRINDLSNMQGSDLELVAVLPGDHKLETALHKMFSIYRVRGEWFTPSFKIISTFRILVEEAKSGHIVEEQEKLVVKDEQNKPPILIKKSLPLMYQMEEIDEIYNDKE